MKHKTGLPRYLLPLFLLLVSLLAVTGCAGPDPAPGQDNGEPAAEEEPPAISDAFIVPVVETPPAVDGAPADYPGAPFQVAGMEGYMAHDGEAIYFYLQAEAGGWLSAGFNREGGGMDGANIVIGFSREDGTPVLRNDLGQGRTHSETTDGIIDGVFVEQEQNAVLEFAYPLQFPAGPQFNVQALQPGQVYTLILAFQARSQDPEQRHSRWGRLDFILE